MSFGLTVYDAAGNVRLDASDSLCFSIAYIELMLPARETVSWNPGVDCTLSKYSVVCGLVEPNIYGFDFVLTNTSTGVVIRNDSYYPTSIYVQIISIGG